MGKEWKRNKKRKSKNKKDILRYNGTTDKWLNVGKMTTPRFAYSLALLTDISKICP